MNTFSEMSEATARKHPTFDEIMEWLSNITDSICYSDTKHTWPVEIIIIDNTVEFVFRGFPHRKHRIIYEEVTKDEKAEECQS